MISRQASISLGMLVILLIWWLAALSLNRNFLPAPPLVFQTFISEMQGGLLPHIRASLERVLLGVTLGTLLAAPAAILAAENKSLDRLLSPIMYFLYPAPKIVFLPIIVLFLGLGNPSIIFLIAVVIFFQIYVIVRDATSQVAPQTLDSVQALGATRLERLRYVYVPVSLPAIITALKVGIGTAIAVLFIAETFGVNQGLGYYIVVEQWNRFAYPKIYAGILAINLLGSLLFGLLVLLESRISRWQKN